MGYLAGSQCSNWGSLASHPVRRSEAQSQGESRGLCWCEVADESVVVCKIRPMKPSNGVEDKTELTINIAFDGALTSQKRLMLRREEAYSKSVASNKYECEGAQAA